MRLFSPISYIIPAHVITVTVLVACPPVIAQQLLQIVNVEVRETESGIELVLETADGSPPEYVETPDGNILYIDLVDAQLDLTSGKDFQVDNPTAEISSITVSEEFVGSVSIVIQGAESPPQVQLTANPQGGIFSITTSPATAQTNPIPPTNDESSDQEIEIIVRGETDDDDYVARETSIGRGSPQSVLKTPRSVQTITEEVIKDQNITNISEITRVVSGINTGGTAAVQDPGSSFVIRGFSAVSGRENILRNGLRDDTIRLVSDIANIERVEVLKGPASVLFGQGIVGGSINLVTKKPLDEPFYAINLTAGNFNTYQGNIDFTAPIDPNGDLAYRLNISYENEESFKNFQEEDFIFTDLVATLVKSEQTELNVGIEYQKSKFEGSAPQLPASGTVIDNPLGEVDIEENLGEPSLAESEQTVVRLSSDLEHKFNDNWKLQNQFLASFQETPDGIGFTGVGLDGNRLFRRVLSENFSSNDIYTINTNVVGEFNTGTIEHQLLVGLEFANQEQIDQIDFRFLDDIDIFDPVYSPDSVRPVVIPFSDQVTSFQEVGIYLQDQITLVDGLILALGGRYNIADSEFSDSIDPDLNSDRVDTSFTPSAGIIYQPTENISFYASYAKSFLPNVGRSRETDLELGQTILGDEFDPEEGRQFEIGLKAELFDDNILATLALFDLKRTNVLNPQTLSSSQVGEQKSRGIELDIAGEILPGWKIISSYAYTDTEILDDEVIPDGNKLQNVPEHAFSIWTTYDIQQGSLEGLGFGLGFFFEGEKQGNLENSFSLPSYFRTDAALFYERDQFKAQLNVKNLFDIRYFESARDEFRVNAGAPFTISGTVSLKF